MIMFHAVAMATRGGRGAAYTIDVMLANQQKYLNIRFCFKHFRRSYIRYCITGVAAYAIIKLSRFNDVTGPLQ